MKGYVIEATRPDMDDTKDTKDAKDTDDTEDIESTQLPANNANNVKQQSIFDKLPEHLIVLLSKEQRWKSWANGLDKHPDVTQGMRMILVDWLTEVKIEYGFTRFTLHRSVMLLDYFIMATSNPIKREKLQLVGATCMLIGCKFEEIDQAADLVDFFVYMTDNSYTCEEIIAMETNILCDVDWQLCQPTAYEWLEWCIYANERVVQESDILTTFALTEEEESMLCHVCRALLDSTLLCVGVLKYTPSILARGCLNAGQMITGERIEAEDGIKVLTLRIIGLGVGMATSKSLNTVCEIHKIYKPFELIKLTGKTILNKQ